MYVFRSFATYVFMFVVRPLCISVVLSFFMYVFMYLISYVYRYVVRYFFLSLVSS